MEMSSASQVILSGALTFGIPLILAFRELAAFATLNLNQLTLNAAWGDPHGVLELVGVHMSAPVTDLASATALGEHVAVQLQAGVLAKGGSLLLSDAPKDES